jgi:hypothetical protein
MKSSTKLTGPAKTKLSGYIAGFNLPDLPLADVLARADDIRQRPDEVLPRVLQYDRLISQSYFNFVHGLWKHQCAFDPFAVWNSVSPHMYRMLRCLAYQFPGALPILATSGDSEFLRYSAIKSLSALSIFVLRLKSPEAPFFVEALLDIARILSSSLKDLIALPSSPIFNGDVLEWIQTLCMATKESALDDKQSGVLLVQVVAMLQALFHAGIVAARNCCKFIDLGPLLLASDPSSDVLHSVLTLMDLAIVFVPSVPEDDAECMFSLWNAIVQKLHESGIGHAGVIADSVISVTLRTIPTADVPLPDPIPVDEEVKLAPPNFEFYDQDLMADSDVVLPHVSAKCRMIEDSLGISWKYILSLFSLTPPIASAFFTRITARPGRDPTRQLLLTAVLANLKLDLLNNLLREVDDPASHFINNLAFNSEAVKTDGNEVFRALFVLTITLISNVFAAGDCGLCLAFLRELKCCLIESSLLHVSCALTVLETLADSSFKVLAVTLAGSDLAARIANLDFALKRRLLDGEISDEILAIRSRFLRLLVRLSADSEFEAFWFGTEFGVHDFLLLLGEKGIRKLVLEVLAGALERAQTLFLIMMIREFMKSVPRTTLGICLIQEFFGIFERSFCAKSEIVFHSFSDVEMLTWILPLVLTFSEVPDSEAEFGDLVIGVLKVFYGFCHMSRLSLVVFADPKFAIRDSLVEVFQRVEITKEHLD